MEVKIPETVNVVELESAPFNLNSAVEDFDIAA